MARLEWRQAAARSSLERLLPRIEKNHEMRLAGHPQQWQVFKERLEREWERLFACLHDLYGWQYDFFYTLEQVLDLLVGCWLDRPQALRRRDAAREADPLWYTSENVVGIVLYVDLFSNNLAGLENHISYFE
ncbi:MAG TPA: amylosucrase, partial [Desulfobacterales bacterium]|nr:amylosucrase [Desulfobacterales bacterium]